MLFDFQEHENTATNDGLQFLPETVMPAYRTSPATAEKVKPQSACYGPTSVSSWARRGLLLRYLPGRTG